MLIIITFVISLLATCTTTQAWNSSGHQVVDLIAWSQLSEADQSAAVSLLKNHPRFEQHFLGRVPDNIWNASEAEKDQWIFAHAGTWPDIVRSKSDVVTREDVARFSRPTWHYINLHIFLTPADRDALASSLAGNRDIDPPADRDDRSMNIAQAISNSLRIIRDDNETRQNRSVHLCWLLHLVGDSHQPCHAGSLHSRIRFPEGDRGANKIPIRGGGGKLHGYWDAAILPVTTYNKVRSEAVKLSAKLRASKKANDPGANDLEPKTWLVESWNLSKALVYSQPIREAIAAAENAPKFERINLPAKYHSEAGGLSKFRAFQAGRRLAALLSGHLPQPSDSSRTVEFKEPVEEQSSEASKDEPADKRLWLNTKSGSRHNSTCEWFENTRGRFCTSDEGHPCGQCGG